MKVFYYRLYPTKAQKKNLNQTLELCRCTYNQTLELCRWTYNQTLALRKNAWETEQKNIDPGFRSIFCKQYFS
jgi:putative transposase